MQNREKKLAIAFGSVVGVMAVWSVLRPWYIGPIQQEEGQLASVQTELDSQQNRQMQQLAAGRKMAEWKAQSLPPDVKPIGRQRADALNGQRLYQEWLTDLARHAGFTNPVVVPLNTQSVQDVYVTAQVRIKAEANYSELCQFLSLFEQADLLHRIHSCIIESSNYRGNPRFDVTLVAEGVALQNAPQREMLFPRTELAAAIDADDSKVLVKDALGFPKAGRFGIRIDEELFSVVQVKGKEWQITRGRDNTKPVAHIEGGKVDLGLYDPLTHDGPAKEPHPKFAMLAGENPFTVPLPPNNYNPRLNLPREQVAYVGSPLSIEVKAEDFNQTLAPPKFELTGKIPEGMKLATLPDRPYSGLITWEPADESLIANYPISIQVTRNDLEKPLTASVLVRVEERNLPPELTGPGSQTVYSGQPLAFTVKATDEPDQRITYSVGASAPPEATIDPATGEFSWTPPGVVTEQTFEIEILASDNGRPSAQGSIRVSVEVKADVAHFTRFVGSLSESETSEAWLFDRWNKRDLVIREGEMLEVADIEARLMKVQQDTLVLERDGKTFELSLGQDVRNMKPVAAAQTAETAKAN